MEKDKNKIIYILIIIVILILIILGIYKVIQNREAENITTEEATEENSDTLTPEEVLEQMEEDETVILSDSAKVSIISPEGESFSIGQARMWEAEFVGIEKGSFRATCHWEFYMNDELYKTMDNTSYTSLEDPTACGFTSTFIDVYGTLKVKLNIEAKNMYNDILGTYNTEREYSVL